MMHSSFLQWVKSLRALPIAACVALSLGACSSSDTGNNASEATANDGGDAATGNALPEASAENSAGPAGADFMNNEQNAVSPIDLPEPKSLPGIPAKFNGRWGMVPNDCTSTSGDAKGLMTITGDTLKFYESRARADDVVARGGGRTTMRLRFSGEGQNWTTQQSLTMESDGRTLIRQETDPPQSYTYSRCPNS